MSEHIDIGKKLRQKRNLLDLSLHDAEHQTRIPRTILHALEKNDWDHFSCSTYARSFLNQYGNFLSVNVNEALLDLSPKDPLASIHKLAYLNGKKDHLGKQHNSEEVFHHLQTYYTPKTQSPNKKSDGSSLLRFMTLIMVSTAIITLSIHFSRQTNATPKKEQSNESSESIAITENAELGTKSPNQKNTENLVATNKSNTGSISISELPKARTTPPPKALLVAED